MAVDLYEFINELSVEDLAKFLASFNVYSEVNAIKTTTPIRSMNSRIVNVLVAGA